METFPHFGRNVAVETYTISERQDQRCRCLPTGSFIRVFDRYRNHDLGWPWTAIVHFAAQNIICRRSPE